MKNEVFTASNGSTIGRVGGSLRVADENGYGLALSRSEEQAFREYFLAERDKELGHWRFDENHVVFEVKQHRFNTSARVVRVVIEETGQYFERHEDRVQDAEDFYSDAARAYFDAHPLPKPWHDAKPGEVWALRTSDSKEEVALQVYSANGETRFCSADGLTDFPENYPGIIAGRRIWPEGDK